ncbi:hypothetical protein NPX13_g3771 [Xylaria arbuscula]|uniref:Uncharacterized protein n=1 Tax=Xylaria arbuscula TaxID=114810 RepID=A0A9W8NGN6_9PEZI|nr:hypothetical protein NPX13_g3771 [Xylaria arbuscula]
MAKSPEMQRFQFIAADVSKTNYVERVVADATGLKNERALEFVWCLAGVSTPMLWTNDNALEAAQHNMDVNYSRSAKMSRAIMRARLLPGHGKQQQSSTPTRRPIPKHIAFTGSVLSTFSLAGHGTYCPSKLALRALADTLAMEARLA